MTQKAILESVLRELKYRKIVSTQEDFGKKLGYGKSYFSQVMNGAEPLSGKMIDKIETEFRISPDYLRNGKGEIMKADQPEAPPIDKLMSKIDTLVSSIETDRETVKKRLDKVEASSDKLYKDVVSLQGWQGQVDHKLGLIESRLVKLIMNDPNSGAAVFGKKRRN